jgi:prolyl 4-hydroxylase
MIKTRYLSAEWKQWLESNVARGCTAQSMIDVMVGNNFERGFATDAVQTCLAAASASTSDSATDEVATDLQAKNGTIDDLAGAAEQHGDSAAYVYETPRLPQSGALIRTGDQAIRVAIRIDQPVVAVFDNVLTREECEELIRQSEAKLRRSTIVDPQTGREAVIDERSSQGAFFALNENDFIRRLDTRISQLMQLPPENGEGLQILNYRAGGEYRPHFDFFPLDEPGSKTHLARGGQRVSTLVIYLNGVEEGGETVFPELGLAVVPRLGSAVYFEYCNSRGQTDAMTLHGGNPVTRGEKWIATKWMRQARYG